MSTCSGCGLVVEDADAGCQLIMDACVARDFTDASYFSTHRLFVDTYSMQHPDRYCVSFKSFAAHFTGLCWLVEFNGNRAVGSEKLRHWVGRNAQLSKPELPAFRGAMTIADIADAPDLVAHREALDRWARSTWDAYGPLHDLARSWIREALG